MKTFRFAIYLLTMFLVSSQLEAQSNQLETHEPSNEWSLGELLTISPYRPIPEVGGQEISSRNMASANSDSKSGESKRGILDRVKNKVLSWWNGEPEVPRVAKTNQVHSVETSEVVHRAPSASPEDVAQLQKIKAVSESIKSERDRVKYTNIITSTGGRAADPSLEKYKSGVARFRLEKKTTKKDKSGKEVTVSVPVQSIPKIDIGEEPLLRLENFELSKFEVLNPNLKKISQLSSPSTIGKESFQKIMGSQVVPEKAAKDIGLARLDRNQKVTMETVQKIQYIINQDAVVHELAHRELTQQEETLLRALLLVEHGDKCHAATSYLKEVKDHGDGEFQSFVNFHLGMCQHKMGLFTEAFDSLKVVLAGPNGKYKKEAIKAVLSDLPNDFETDLVRVLREVPESEIEEGLRDEFNYRVAKASARLEHFNFSKSFAEKVKASSKRFSEAQFVLAVSEYALGNERAAFQRLTTLQKSFGNKKSPLSDMVALNLGRMAYQQKDIKTSIDNFNKIGKDHPLWIQALTEQGWMQLLVSDSSGAIGNMYSLHSPYFNAAFKPETYVIRTIGYLNLCQYGDARNTLEYLQGTQNRTYQQIKEYRKSGAQSKIYNTLLSFLKNSAQKNVDGLPQDVLREIGRQREFLNLQEAINNRLDEIGQYGFIEQLLAKDRSKALWYRDQAQSRIAKLKSQTAKAKDTASLQKDVPEWNRQISYESKLAAYYEFEASVYGDSLKNFRDQSKVARNRISQERTKFQKQAGESLSRQLASIESKLKNILENNELLRYEVLAGSGENIRFLAAGGAEKSKRVPASVNKDLNWKFVGEIWEDEIGHYRSQLVDLCPKRNAQR